MRRMLLSLALCGLWSAAGASSQILGGLPGFPVTPASLQVQLSPGDDLSFYVCVSVPASHQVDLDVYLLEDLSGSFGDDLANLNSQFGGLYTGLNGTYNSAAFGFGGFVDKPVMPFGNITYNDYVYQTFHALSLSQPSVQAAIGSAVIRWGGDAPEAQLEALMQAALREAELAWRPGARRVVVLFTDATYHVAGNFSSAPANNGDTVLDGSPAGTGEDYPSLLQVRNALQAAGVIPIFAVTSAQVPTYQALVNSWGFGAVTTITSNSSNLISAINTALNSVSTSVSLQVSGDTGGFVQSVNPPSFSNVSPGESVCFDVSLLTDQPCAEGSVDLQVPGFGVCAVTVLPDPADCTVEAVEQPARFQLEPNAPNPFNPFTTIAFTLERTEAVTLSVHDLLGRQVAVLTQGLLEAGRHECVFDAGQLPSGVYSYTLQTAGATETRKMLLLK